jgi:hypothetical protein
LPARYVLHPEAGFVEEVLEGDVTLVELRAMFVELFADPGWDPGFDGLVDLSAGRLHLSHGEVGAIAQQLSADRSASRGRWAFVLGDPVNHGIVRMFASMSENPPRDVRIFPDRQAAVEWLVSRRGGVA